MVEQGRPSINPLASELQSKLNFEYSPNREWLINDDLVRVGGVDLYESLPTRARILANGTRFEIGARKVDLEGVLELAKILKPNVQGVDHITSFWQGNPKVKVSEEGKYVYMGVDIKPTPRGLEEEYSSVQFAHHVALAAAIEGKTYDQMLQEDRKYGGLIKDIEISHERRAGSLLFPRPPRDYTESSASCEITPPVTVDTLREYPLGSIRHGLLGAPGTVRVEERKSRDFVNGSWIVIQPGDNPGVFNGSKYIEILIPPSNRSLSPYSEGPYDGVAVNLQIPEGVEVQTVDDIRKLKIAEVLAKPDNQENFVSKKTQVEVAMEDDSFKIVSADGSLELELRKPCCPECKTPAWKWPFIEDSSMKGGVDPKDWGDNVHLYSGGGDGFYPRLEGGEGEQVPYCGDCINTVVDRYKAEHPFASRTKTIEFARQKLDETGYQDVEIMEGQVWNRDNEWEIYTRLEYERDGRKIARFTGNPRLTHDGEFTPNMFPREYVEFRYKTS